jgi:hypothetical protein
VEDQSVATKAPAVTPIAYPTLTEAAAMVGVKPPTLSRLPDLKYIPAGGRDHRIPAAEVLRLAEHFGRRSIDEVGFDLVAYCHAQAPEMEEAVTAEVDNTVAAFYRAAPAPSIEAFLRDARRFLPSELFSEVAQTVLAEGVKELSETAVHVPTKRVVKGRRKVAAAASKSSRTSSKQRARELV